MKKLRFILIWLLVLSISQIAHGEAFSFPSDGVLVTMQDGWTLVTLDTLDENVGALSQQGIDTKLLRLDMETSRAVFAIFMPSGARVMLSRYETAQTLPFHSIKEMSDVERVSFLAAYSNAPYENTRWAVSESDAFSYLQFDYALQSNGEVTQFAGIATVWEGALYQLTATGKIPAEMLHEASEQVYTALSFFPATPLHNAEDLVEIPEPIADDGVLTPIALLDFTGISYDDLTSLNIQTLPFTEVVIITANDRLRATTKEDGLHLFRVSTRREMVYTYTIEVTAPERATSQMKVSVVRQLRPELQAEAYRKSARTLASIGYEKLLSNPSALSGTAVTFRGKLSHFERRDGIPCALFYTQNTQDDLWKDPLWVKILEPATLFEDKIYTIYGDVTTEVMDFVNEDGIPTEVPILLLKSIGKE